MKLLIFMTVWVGMAGGQVLRLGGGAAKPRPMNSGESITLGASPSSVNLNLVARGVSAPTGSMTLSISWTVTQTRSLSVYAYFGNSTAALTGGSPMVSIPSSAVLGSTYNGSSWSTFAPFTSTNPFNGQASALEILANRTIASSGSGSGLMRLEIDLSGAGLDQVPAGSFTGVLLLQAQAI